MGMCSSRVPVSHTPIVQLSTPTPASVINTPRAVVVSARCQACGVHILVAGLDGSVRGYCDPYCLTALWKIAPLPWQIDMQKRVNKFEEYDMIEVFNFFEYP
jgi:hypothetical protein